MSVPVWEAIAEQLTLLNHPRVAAFETFLRALELLARKEDSCSSACATSPLVGGRDRNFRNWVPSQAQLRDGSVLMNQRWLQQVQKLLTMYQTRHGGASIDQVRDCGTLQDVQTRGQWKAFSNGTRYDKNIRLPPTTTLSHTHSETSWKHSRNVSRCC